jgi:hypothetical protein
MEIVFNMIFINLYIHMYLIIRCGELYGEFKKTTMEWKDDLMRVVMLDNMFKIKQNKCGNFGFHPRVMCTAKKCMGHMSHPRMSEHQNYHEKLGNLVSRFSFCAF